MTRIPGGAPVVTAAQMRAAEYSAFAAGMTQDGAMERAGAAVAEQVRRFAVGRPVLVLAGPGNNGADGYVAARLLRERGLDVQVAALGEATVGPASAMRRRWTGPVVPLAEAQPRPVLVDGLFGTGLARALAPQAAEALHRLVARAAFSIAIDLPSGIETDTGEDLGAPDGIDCTVALAALKPAHLIGDGLAKAGHVLLADIGIPVDTRWRTVARPALAAPAMATHKYTRGLVMVAEGAMPGASRLAARAAIHGGAGYGVLAGAGPFSGPPDALVRRLAVGAPEWAALFAEERIRAIAAGPGLGRDGHARMILGAALASRHPLVLDGDALWLLGEEAAERLKGRAAPVILTPHGGEFDRMFGKGSGSKIDRTIAAAQATGAVVVHKGADTVIAYPAGEVSILSGASNWLSTAGTGDVLAGLVAARIAAGGPRAAEEAVWLHARAAQLAGAAFIADALIARIPEAVQECL
ncbi:MAG: NAD(P)H-hydrate epimerase [Pseudomonadota bacterium]